MKIKGNGKKSHYRAVDDHSYECHRGESPERFFVRTRAGKGEVSIQQVIIDHSGDKSGRRADDRVYMKAAHQENQHDVVSQSANPADQCETQELKMNEFFYNDV